MPGSMSPMSRTLSQKPTSGRCLSMQSTNIMTQSGRDVQKCFAVVVIFHELLNVME